MSGTTESRSLQKFLRHRPAMCSLAIIAVYLITAAVLLFSNLVTLQDTLEPVAAFNLPGFGMQQLPEKRLRDVERALGAVRKALRHSEPAEQLQFAKSGSLVVATSDPAVMQPLAEQAETILKRIHQYPDLDELVAEKSSDAPAMLKDLTALEATVDKMYRVAPDQSEFGRSLRLLLGTDRQGRSIFVRAIWSVRVAILVGLVTGIVSVMFGTMLGLLSGYFGGWVDHLITWLYSTFASIPNIVLLIVLSFAFSGGEVDEWLNEQTGGWLAKLIGGPLEETLFPVFLAFCLTYWIGPCRVVRGEALKLRELEYVQAAKVLGYGRLRILLRHMLPNVAHLMLINFSLLFIGAIKSEVILSFLGLGVKKGPSWGIMINQSGQEVINGFYWQIGTATMFMFGLVLAFNILSDALQDILDPRHVG